MRSGAIKWMRVENTDPHGAPDERSESTLFIKNNFSFFVAATIYYAKS